MKQLIKDLVPYVIIIAVVVLIRTFIATPVQVSGVSMKPTLSNGEILLLKKYDKSFKRFDVVVLNYNNDKLIKRIIGLPGETVRYEDDHLYINGKEIKENFKTNTYTKDFDLDEAFGSGDGTYKVPEDYYFVMGDNRNNSKDSRIIGCVSKKDIKGTIGIAIFPFNKIGKVK